mgnify:CR=1 FL=1
MRRSDKAEVRLTIRLPAEIHAAITEAAQWQNRSFNGQLIHILQGIMPAGPMPRIKE